MAEKRISALFFIIFCLASLSSCGKTGKLYLPDDKPQVNEQAKDQVSHPASKKESAI